MNSDSMRVLVRRIAVQTAGTVGNRTFYNPSFSDAITPVRIFLCHKLPKKYFDFFSPN